MKKTITLSTKEELKTFMSPQRQELMRIMGIHGAPMTAKAAADCLHISASSAQHHIKKLMALGLIEQDHIESINGIRAVFFRLTHVDVSIGYQLSDGLDTERNIISQNILRQTFREYVRGVEALKTEGLSASEMTQYGDMLSGVLYLKPDDAQTLLRIISDYIKMHSVWEKGTEAWEYALIAVNSTALNHSDETVK